MEIVFDPVMYFQIFSGTTLPDMFAEFGRIAYQFQKPSRRSRIPGFLESPVVKTSAGFPLRDWKDIVSDTCTPFIRY